jgi:fructokinase
VAGSGITDKNRVPAALRSSSVIAIGEVLWDLLPTGPVLGGAPLNFAFRMAELGFDSRVLTRVGADQRGAEAKRLAGVAKMDCSLWQTDPAAPTGTVNVTFDGAGKPDFTIVPDVAYDRLEATPDALAAVATAGCLYFGTLIQRTPHARGQVSRLLEAAEKAVALKVLDLNLRRDCHTPESILGSLERADVVKLSDEEAMLVAKLFGLSADSLPTLARRIIGHIPAKILAVTLGADGALVVDRGGNLVEVPGEQVVVADTCGCGDAFTAGLVGGLLSDRSLSESVRLGVKLGSIVATQSGATQPLPPEVLPSLRS